MPLSYRIEQIRGRRLKYAYGLDQIRFPRTVRADEHVQRLKLEFRAVGTERQNVPQLDRSQESLVAEHAVFILLRPYCLTSASIASSSLPASDHLPWAARSR